RRQGAPAREAAAEVRTEPAEFQFGDVIVATTDPDRPGEVTPLPPDIHNPESGLGDVFAFHRRMQRLAGQYITVRGRRGAGGEQDLMVPPAYHYTFGVRMGIGKVAAVRENSPGQQAGVTKGDILQEVILKDSAGGEARFVTDHKKGETAEDLARFVDPL